ncbi:MAG: penicillin-binding protein 2 [Caldilineaceae bacterium]|nr:penicillin-binding protein 2 [Caldilineaceae bacterium]
MSVSSPAKSKSPASATPPAAPPDDTSVPPANKNTPGFSLDGSWRLQVVIAVIVLLGGLLVLRLLDMQLRTWSQYAPTAAGDNSRYTVDDTTPWGVIVDRDGVLLAGDRFTYRVTATPNHIDREEWQALSERLARVADIPAEQVWNRLADNPDGAYVVLASNVPFHLGRALIEEKQREIDAADSSQDLSLLPLGNVFIHAQPRRFYPQGSLASQVLGFLNAERKPVLGLERYYNSFLPSNGVGLPKGSILPRTVLSDQQRKFLPSGSEKGLVLTIDRTIQWIIEEELAEGVQFYGAESGSVIVLDPKSGAILGMANYPTFDANNYENADPASFTNGTISAQYEPGSIFKVITVAGALDAGAVEPTTVFTDTGTIVIGQRTIQNSGRNALGRLSVSDALAQSNNVVTVQIAETLGAEKFYEYVARFGFGADTNVDLAGEVPGLVNAPGSRVWSLSDLGTNSFGQGIAVTPIQMVSAVAAIANQGRLMRPYVVAARVHGNSVLLTQPTLAQQVISPASAEKMKTMMKYVIETGTHAAQIPGYSVGGKSGTADIATAEGYVLDRTIASYIGFAPVDDPRFVMLVKLDRPDPNISRWASQSAAPLFSRIGKRLLDHLNVPPDDVRLARSQ